jgi:DNA-binding IclR family transcriptional regulator
MTKKARDQVWEQAFELLLDQGTFKRAHIEADVSNRTIRDVLSTMEEIGWLTRDSKHSAFWKPGPKAVALLSEEMMEEIVQEESNS